jgi:sulfur-carrier protein adenylyltransferase/sulfurtransferase
VGQFSDEEKLRYNRHFLLPEVGMEGQKKFQQSSVLVVGAGGLGCPALLYLAAAGVGKISILDADTVSLSNLQRQVLYTTNSVGKAKVTVAKQRLMELNPHLELNVCQENFSLENVENWVNSHDVVIDATDNFDTRYLVQDACVKYSKPLSYAAVHRFEGQSCFFPMGPDDPCLRCLFPSPPEAGTLLYLLSVGTQSSSTLPFVNQLFYWDLTSSYPRSLSILKTAGCSCCGAVPRSEIELRLGNSNCELDSKGGDGRNTVPEKKPDLSVEEFFTIWMKGLLFKDANLPWILLDVRLPAEVDVCKIPGSINIPLAELSRRHTELNPELPTVVYCKSGARSAAACKLLTDAGFARVENLGGGILLWRKEKDQSLSFY